MNTFLQSDNAIPLAEHRLSFSHALVHDVLPSLNSHDADFLLHRRLGHLSVHSLRLLRKMDTLGVPITGPLRTWCHSCHTANHKREPKNNVTSRRPHSLPGQHLHSDLAVVNIPAIGNFKYVLTVVDEGADKYYVKLLKSKTDTLTAMRKVAQEIKPITKNNVVQWTFDRGTEFLDHAVQSYVHDELQAETFYSNIESPWENGLAELSFGVLFGITRSFLHDAECSPPLWGFALLLATYIRNRRPSTQSVRWTISCAQRNRASS
jgi:hypothetical protein